MKISSIVLIAVLSACGAAFTQYTIHELRETISALVSQRDIAREQRDQWERAAKKWEAASNRFEKTADDAQAIAKGWKEASAKWEWNARKSMDLVRRLDWIVQERDTVAR